MKSKKIKLFIILSLIIYIGHRFIVASQAEIFIEDGLLKDSICSQVMIAEALTPHLVDRVIAAAMDRVNHQLDNSNLGFYDKWVRSSAAEKVFSENCRGY